MTATENGSQALAPIQPPSQRLVCHDTSRNAYLLDTARFEQSQRIALAMASASLTPKHLLGGSVQQSQANCLRVVNQALRWDLDPFAIMDETYVVHGKLGYQGKLIAAVINARAGLKRRLKYTFSGKIGTDDYTITVVGEFADEDEPRTITMKVGDVKTANDMWKKDPEQKLCYSGATKWARRHCPEVVLGVATDDDLEHLRESIAEIDPTEETEALARRLLGTDTPAAETEQPKVEEAKPEKKSRKKAEPKPADPTPTPPPGAAVMATMEQIDVIDKLTPTFRPEYLADWHKAQGHPDGAATKPALLTVEQATKTIAMMEAAD